jgi:hypothetical protein
MTNSNVDELSKIRDEVNSIQNHILNSAKPWYKNISTIISLSALAFSLLTSYLASKREDSQDIQNNRQDLRVILQRLASLPIQNTEMSIKYKSDPITFATISGFINQENSFLVQQATEIVTKLPKNQVTAAELHAIAMALTNSYNVAKAIDFLHRSIEISEDLNSEVNARRMLSSLQFMVGKPQIGRVSFQECLNIFDKYPGFDVITVSTTTVLTELSWAQAEANFGDNASAMTHVENAERLLQNKPNSPAFLNIRAQVQQAKALMSPNQFLQNQ